MTREQTTTAKSPTVIGVTATATPAQSRFSRKIGNTTFVVSVAFNDKASESIEDKILRLVASDSGQWVIAPCS